MLPAEKVLLLLLVVVQPSVGLDEDRVESRVSYHPKVDDNVIAVKSIFTAVAIGAVCGLINRPEVGNITP